MKRLLSINYSDFSFNLAMFVLRVTLGFMMCLNHGWPKLKNFSEMKLNFPDPFHIGHALTLGLVIFAEIFGSMLLILGLFTRLGAVILFIDMITAVFFVHIAQGQDVKIYELATIFLSGFFAILLVGPGKFSVDGVAGK